MWKLMTAMQFARSSRRSVRFLGTSSVIPANDFDEFEAKNEPILGYVKGSKERRILESALEQYSKEPLDIPIIIGGKEYRTDKIVYQSMPHNHKKKVAKFYYATPELINKAIDTAVESQKEWDRVPFKDKFNMWLKAAEMMAGPWRQRLNATTMVGQAKTIIQAEIDASAELIDFIRLNAYYAKELLKYKPISPIPGVTKNSLRYRGLEGFVGAVAPFNFTAIGGNLAYTPALMGCSVLWKPSDTAVLSNYVIYQIMKDAGVPPGVINFVPADGPTFGNTISASPHLAGINFTGSVP
jgi:1-pyrroline-5-carboxylate dehydrogenase